MGYGSSYDKLVQQTLKAYRTSLTRAITNKQSVFARLFGKVQYGEKMEKSRFSKLSEEEQVMVRLKGFTPEEFTCHSGYFDNCFNRTAKEHDCKALIGAKCSCCHFCSLGCVSMKKPSKRRLKSDGYSFDSHKQQFHNKYGVILHLFTRKITRRKKVGQ